MGEYAEMMLDGTCCCSCGEFLGDGDGFAAYCSSCEPEEIKPIKLAKVKSVKLKKTIPCAHKGCARKFINDEALKQHLCHFHKQKGVFAK